MINKNRVTTRAKLLEKHEAKERLMSNIEENKRQQLTASIWVRYCGLVLVQGSSALALAGFDMLAYWTALWFGLLCYQVTAVLFYREDNRVFKMTEAKFLEGSGSSLETVKALKVKRNREIVYIIGNTMGLILIGLNILTA